LILVIENSLETFWQTYDCLLSKNIKKLAAYTQLSIASLIPIDAAGVTHCNHTMRKWDATMMVVGHHIIVHSHLLLQLLCIKHIHRLKLTWALGVLGQSITTERGHLYCHIFLLVLASRHF